MYRTGNEPLSDNKNTVQALKYKYNNILERNHLIKMHLYGPDRISSVGAVDSGVGAGDYSHGAERAD